MVCVFDALYVGLVRVGNRAQPSRRCNKTYVSRYTSAKQAYLVFSNVKHVVVCMYVHIAVLWVAASLLYVLRTYIYIRKPDNVSKFLQRFLRPKCLAVTEEALL